MALASVVVAMAAIRSLICRNCGVAVVRRARAWPGHVRIELRRRVGQDALQQRKLIGLADAEVAVVDLVRLDHRRLEEREIGHPVAERAVANSVLESLGQIAQVAVGYPAVRVRLERVRAVDVQDRDPVLQRAALRQHRLRERVEGRRHRQAVGRRRIRLQQHGVGNDEHGRAGLRADRRQALRELAGIDRDATGRSAIVGVVADRDDVTGAAAVGIEQAQAVVEIERAACADERIVFRGERLRGRVPSRGGEVICAGRRGTSPRCRRWS